MGHTSDRPFDKFYISRRARCDVQNISMGKQPEENLLQAAGRMSRKIEPRLANVCLSPEDIEGIMMSDEAERLRATRETAAQELDRCKASLDSESLEALKAEYTKRTRAWYTGIARLKKRKLLEIREELRQRLPLEDIRQQITGEVSTGEYEDTVAQVDPHREELYQLLSIPNTDLAGTEGWRHRADAAAALSQLCMMHEANRNETRPSAGPRPRSKTLTQVQRLVNSQKTAPSERTLTQVQRLVNSQKTAPSERTLTQVHGQKNARQPRPLTRVQRLVSGQKNSQQSTPTFDEDICDDEDLWLNALDPSHRRNFGTFQVDAIPIDVDIAARESVFRVDGLILTGEWELRDGTRAPATSSLHCEATRCLHCMALFVNHSSLRKHANNQHFKNMPPDADFTCPHPKCSLVFNNLMYFKNHALRIHGVEY